MNEDRIEMSQRDRDRLKVMAPVMSGRRRQREAARLLGLSVRQVRRIQRRLEAEGDGAVIHRLRGRPSNRRQDACFRRRVVEACRGPLAALGPTMASEKLAAGGLAVPKETLRRWWLEEKLWQPSRRREKHRTRRERRPCFGELATASEARFLKTLNPHDKIQYWAWPATMMRAVTTAYAETDHFEVGKVAMSGGSKNGATPSMAILHDQRMTAVHAGVSPIWDSPLRLCDRKAWDELEAVTGPLRHAFLGGHFGPIYNRGALAAGHRWEDLQKLARDISDGVFITRNIEALRARDVDLLFHPGTHDCVAYDIAWGGKHHPTIPIYLGANTGHGQKKGHPAKERDEQNKAAFLLEHFFDDVDPLLEAPTVERQVVDNTLEVTVRFKADSGEESGRIWWIHDRPIDGSTGYLSKMIPAENWMDMQYDKQRNAWTAEIDLDPKATRIDFFSNHRKTIRYQGKTYPTYISCPYTRVELQGRQKK